jgi:hypothetical protein
MSCKYERELEKAMKIPGFKPLYIKLKSYIPLIQMLKTAGDKENLKRAFLESEPTAKKLFELLEENPHINPSLIDLT